jgi:glycosyltransferase involved in cell wall biosynthesis
LGRALASALRQTLRNIEIVCVDDGSTDKTVQILQNYAAKDPRIRVVILPKNRGTLYARMVAVRAAGGQFLLSLDSDDLLEPDIALKAAATAMASGTDVVEFAMRERRCGSPFLRLFPWASPRPHLVGKICRQPQLLVGIVAGSICNSTVCNHLVRRTTFLSAVEEIPTDLLTGKVLYGEDTFLCLLTSKHARSYTAIADCGYRYLRRASSVTGKWPRHFPEFLEKVDTALLLCDSASALLPPNLRSMSEQVQLGELRNRFLENKLDKAQNKRALNHAMETMDQLHFSAERREFFLVALCHGLMAGKRRRKFFLFRALGRLWQRVRDLLSSTEGRKSCGPGATARNR